MKHNYLGIRWPQLQQRKSSAIQKLKVLSKHWMGLQRTRKQLSQLNEQQLDDIGLSRSEANDEINKPFWTN